MINLYNDNCYEKIKQLEDKSIDLVIIDPPYKFNNCSGGGAFGNDKRKYHNEYIELCDNNEVWQKEYDRVKSLGKDDKTATIFANRVRSRVNINHLSLGFSNDILDELVRVMKKINIYIWCSKGQLRQILDYFDDLGCYTDVLVWLKTNPVPTCNNTYLSDTEYLIFAREKGVKIYGSYETKHKYYITKTNVEDKKTYNHPTIKPLQIIKNLIINSSLENDTVLDCFMGSGTTGVACKELNRNFIGMELNKEYYEIAYKRINET